MLRRGVLLVIFSLLAVLGTATALAAPPVECPPGTTPDPASGECIIIVTDPGGGGGSGDDHNGGGGGSTGSAKPSCTFTLGLTAQGRSLHEQGRLVVPVSAGLLPRRRAAAAVARPGVGRAHRRADLHLHAAD